MTTPAVSERVSFCRDFLSEFLVFLKAEWRWILVFSLVLSAGSVVAFAGVDLQDLAALREQAWTSRENAVEFLSKYGQSSLLFAIYVVLVKIAATYIMTAIGLRSLGLTSEPQLSWRGFFYWFVKIVQKYALVVLPAFLAAVLVGGIRFWGLVDPNSFVAGFVLASLPLAAISFSFVGLYFLYVVSPLAVLGRKSVIRTSIRLTKKHLWRIFWPSIVILLGLFAAFAPVFLAQWGSLKFLGMYSPLGYIVSSFVESLWDATLLSAMTLYACVVYRALDREEGAALDEPTPPVS